MPFAQLVIGSPGSGKTTYCAGMHQFLSAIGRKASIVNLDPANDPQSAYPCAMDIRDLVRLEDLQREEELGPNGGVLYALEELEENWEWMEEGLRELGGECLGAGFFKNKARREKEGRGREVYGDVWGEKLLICCERGLCTF